MTFNATSTASRSLRATLRYRATKYVKRNKAFTAAAAVFLLALTVGLIVALWQLRFSREREREQRRELYVARLRQASVDFAAGNMAGYQEALDNCVPKNGGGVARLRGATSGDAAIARN